MGQYFSTEAIADLRAGLAKVVPKALALRQAYVQHEFRTERGKEYALHGFARRLDGLAHCIHTVFEAVPPELGEIPERERLVEAAVNIQAFVVNVAGCCDNAAWTWVFENAVAQQDGSPLPQRKVGLTSEHKLVWGSFPDTFRTYLTSRRPWFKHVKAFRDSLAHRIPLYIPPHTVDPRDVGEYQRLEHERLAALLRGNLSLHEELEAEQLKLMKFSPFIIHSAAEESPTALFHAQLLADFVTVEELGQKLLLELEK